LRMGSLAGVRFVAFLQALICKMGPPVAPEHFRNPAGDL
jgi:hypothetical protein